MDSDLYSSLPPEQTIDIKRAVTRGIIVGVLGAVAYTLFFVIWSVGLFITVLFGDYNDQNLWRNFTLTLGLCFTFGMFGAFVASIIGAVSGALIATVEILVWRWRTICLGRLVGAVVCSGLALLIHLVLFSLGARMGRDSYLFLPFLDIPTVIYILAGCWFGGDLYKNAQKEKRGF